MSPRTELVTTHALYGSNTRVFSYPASTASSAGVIFAIHGFRGDHHGLTRIIEQLPQYTIIVPDLPGFGASTSMQLAHDVDGYALALNDLADELHLPAHSILLGHSFGSLVAAKLATQRGFSALLLLNPISELALESSQAFIAKLTGCYYTLCAKLPAPLGEAVLRSKLFSDAMSLVMTKSKDPAMRAYVREQHRAYFGGFHSRDTLAQSYQASISCTVGGYAGTIGIPALLVGGMLDELGTAQTQETLRASFAHAELVMLEDVGHLIHYEKAPETAAAITKFLARIDA
ncbi:alpha/beta fold hydrolase [Glutamicibacter sp. AOP38-B1-38]|uniref:alpha/beta fold hydrolase n=1 Tax=unclassified Glutamicibacter TaxID=2627139 RepID=UPI00403415F7